MLIPWDSVQHGSALASRATIAGVEENMLRSSSSHHAPPSPGLRPKVIGLHLRALARFPVSAGILLGIGLGGLLEAIVFRHLLQLHQAIGGTGEHNAALNTFWGGVFELAAVAFVAAGVIALWHHARNVHLRWPASLFAASVITGIGGYLLGEGILIHWLLGIHHVNDAAQPAQRLLWDAVFVGCGFALLIGGGARLIMEQQRS
jgi:uncharacterized membrane protein